MTTPVRIALCDDHRIVTDGFRDMVSGLADIECVGAAQDGVEALELLANLKVDVLITDLDMPRMNGLQLCERAKRAHPHMRVLVLSMHHEPAVVKQAMDAGADGYLVKSAGRDEVLLAIREVHAGRKHFGSGVMEAFLQQERTATTDAGPLEGLSQREVEVLAALAEGFSNKEIGERLFISPRTVDTHRTNLMKKLDVHNVAGLVRIALKAGLVK